MNIDQILNDKGREVISVKADSSLAEAARTLDEKRIGAVVALGEGGTIAGVLSERDIVRQVARNGETALKMLVGDAMTREVITIDASMKLEDAMQLMTDRRIRHLPVFRNERQINPFGNHRTCSNYTLSSNCNPMSNGSINTNKTIGFNYRFARYNHMGSYKTMITDSRMMSNVIAAPNNDVFANRCKWLN